MVKCGEFLLQKPGFMEEDHYHNVKENKTKANSFPHIGCPFAFPRILVIVIIVTRGQVFHIRFETGRDGSWGCFGFGGFGVCVLRVLLVWIGRIGAIILCLSLVLFWGDVHFGKLLCWVLPSEPISILCLLEWILTFLSRFRWGDLAFLICFFVGLRCLHWSPNENFLLSRWLWLQRLQLNLLLRLLLLFPLYRLGSRVVE